MTFQAFYRRLDPNACDDLFGRRPLSLQSKAMNRLHYQVPVPGTVHVRITFRWDITEARFPAIKDTVVLLWSPELHAILLVRSLIFRIACYCVYNVYIKEDVHVALRFFCEARTHSAPRMHPSRDRKPDRSSS